MLPVSSVTSPVLSDPSHLIFWDLSGGSPISTISVAFLLLCFECCIVLRKCSECIAVYSLPLYFCVECFVEGKPEQWSPSGHGEELVLVWVFGGAEWMGRSLFSPSLFRFFRFFLCFWRCARLCVDSHVLLCGNPYMILDSGDGRSTSKSGGAGWEWSGWSSREEEREEDRHLTLAAPRSKGPHSSCAARVRQAPTFSLQGFSLPACSLLTLCFLHVP